MTTTPTGVVERIERATSAAGCEHAIFVPETLLPEQFLARSRYDSQRSPEKALMLAVLEDAIRCFQGLLRHRRNNPRALAREAEQWIRTVGDPWPCSFDNVCDALGIDSEALRDALLAWKGKQRAARRSGAPVPDRVYRLHLRLKRQAAVG